MTATVPAPERAHDGLSRRRILQGAAWAAPAIVLASAAPAFAVGSGDASTSTPVASGSFTAALKNPGATQKAGSLVMTRQDTGSTIPFVITSITIAFTSTQQNQGTQGGISTAGWEVVRFSHRVRLRERVAFPSATTIGGLLPLSLTGGSMWAPFGFAVIGGLVASTVITLGVQPTAYFALERWRSRKTAAAGDADDLGARSRSAAVNESRSSRERLQRVR